MTERGRGCLRFVRRVLGRGQGKEEVPPAGKQEGQAASGRKKTSEEILFLMKFGKR